VNVKSGEPQNRINGKERKWKDFNALTCTIKKSHEYTLWRAARKKNRLHKENKQLLGITASEFRDATNAYRKYD
jgi:hypothetical protein